MLVAGFLISRKIYWFLSSIHFPSQSICFQPQKRWHVFRFLYLEIGSGTRIIESSLLAAATDVEVESA